MTWLLVSSLQNIPREKNTYGIETVGRLSQGNVVDLRLVSLPNDHFV